MAPEWRQEAVVKESFKRDFSAAVSRWNSVFRREAERTRRDPKKGRVTAMKAVRMTYSVLYNIRIIPPFGSPHFTSWDSIMSYIGNATALKMKLIQERQGTVSHMEIRPVVVFDKLICQDFGAYKVRFSLMCLASDQGEGGLSWYRLD